MSYQETEQHGTTRRPMIAVTAAGDRGNRSPVSDAGKVTIVVALGLLLFFFASVGRAATCSFDDVPASSPFHDAICRLVAAGITAGCDPTHFCPDKSVTGAAMAVFLERAIHGPSYTPPACKGGVFVDVACPGAFAPWIEQCASEGVCYGSETGSGIAPTYCPAGAIYRQKVAVELLRGKHGGTWIPPALVGPCAKHGVPIFADVASCWWARPWIEDLYNEGISGGCATNPLRYCPLSGFNRAQMAVMIMKAWGL